MQILSFDSSGFDVQIALMQDGKIVLEKTIAAAGGNRQEAASTLLPGVDAALKSLGWSKKDLDLLVVGIGPGSFTGVRVSVITARSVAQALGLGLIPISSLEAIASVSTRPASVLLPAGGGKYFLSAYDADEVCSLLLEPVCSGEAEVTSKLKELAKVERLLLAPELDEATLASGKTVVPYPDNLNFATASALLAWKRLNATNVKLKRESLSSAYPWDNVLPLYLRSPSVTLKANGSSNKTSIGS